MRQESFSLSDVDGMIDMLDHNIAAGTDSPAMLEECQERLDLLEGSFRGHVHFAQHYSRMLEVQALIFGRRSPHDRDEQAMSYMKEAVRQAGSVSALRSSTLKAYISSHNRPAVNPAASVHARAFAQPATVEVEEPHAKHHRHHASVFHKKPGFRNLKVAIAGGLAVLVLAIGGYAAFPQASGVVNALTNRSQLSTEKQSFNKLAAEYKECSTKLTAEKSSINQNDMTAVDNYNKAVSDCKAVQQQQNKAADTYNKLVADK
jgi:hypothetical protein